MNRKNNEQDTSKLFQQPTLLKAKKELTVGPVARIYLELPVVGGGALPRNRHQIFWGKECPAQRMPQDPGPTKADPPWTLRYFLSCSGSATLA